MKFYIVDAFTDQLFGGNPAGVVILDKDAVVFPEDTIMIKVASELKYSETAFIKELSKGEFHIRYFTPVAEVDLCGHATICSIFCLIDQGLIQDSGESKYSIITKAGKLSVFLKNGLAMMEMGSINIGEIISNQKNLFDLATIMGIDVNDIGLLNIDGKNLSENYLPQLVSTGLFDIILPLKSEDALAKISPDYQALSKLSEKYNVVGVHAFCLNEKFLASKDSKSNSINETLAYCRNFAPLYGIDEEAATGTANGALLAYLFERNLVLPNITYKIEQGGSMDRPSEIFGRLDFDSEFSESESAKKNPPIIKIGGKAKILTKGEIFI